MRAAWGEWSPLHFRLCCHESLAIFLVLFACFWLCWSSLLRRLLSLQSMRATLRSPRVGFSFTAVASRCRARALGHAGFSGRRLPGSRAQTVVVAHRLSCSAACGIFPDQGSNPCLLHWQMDSLPLSHQGSPWPFLTKTPCLCLRHNRDLQELWRCH